jgi:quercetin dioxygenase-like cupin family protein
VAAVASVSDVQLGRAVIVDSLAARELGVLGAAAAGVYDRPVGIRALHVDAESGEEHYLIRYPAGLQGRPHRHTAAHTIVVLEGRLRANGEVIGPHAYAHFPAGEVMHHEAADDSGCLFVLMFHGPFDVEVVADGHA